MVKVKFVAAESMLKELQNESDEVYEKWLPSNLYQHRNVMMSSYNVFEIFLLNKRACTLKFQFLFGVSDAAEMYFIEFNKE